MKIVCIVLFLSVSISARAMDAKAVCKELTPVIAELQQQTPITIDYMTVLVGVQAIYISGRCYLNYSHVLNTNVFVKEMASENTLSFEENFEFLQTQEGETLLRDAISELAINFSDINLAAFKAVKGMSVTYSYSFDDAAIKPVRVTTIDN
ncbi:hypothetical protein [Alcanivorax sp. 1008]|uniref:hypothetical protein n=1 Tax=Alcanivorax sp. 1008 TaxID=2816853 RepID=UPI001D99A375|nr:hypothetical protein [Alcanivorax sp. 1008]MCC1496784.1 hypothetical protein [Alcanivorax sp. 1008]